MNRLKVVTKKPSKFHPFHNNRFKYKNKIRKDNEKFLALLYFKWLLHELKKKKQ